MKKLLRKISQEFKKWHREANFFTGSLLGDIAALIALIIFAAIKLTSVHRSFFTKH